MTPARGGTSAGLAAERTVLAWQRTSLALAVCGGLLLVRSPLGGSAGLVLAAAAFVLAGRVAVLGARRSRALEQDQAAPALPARTVVVLGAAVAGLALGAGASVLLAR